MEDHLYIERLQGVSKLYSFSVLEVWFCFSKQCSLTGFALSNEFKESLGLSCPYNACTLSRALGNAELRVLVRTFFPWDA